MAFLALPSALVTDSPRRLAHCSQMNHSRAFWDVRNKYAEQMEKLWQRRYTGEGLWGRGALLETGEFERNMVRSGESLPEHLCGGTYRSRRRKRKAKETLTYKEQKERRILKKFGANGVALGDDEVAKRRLENGRINSAAPRVAGSKRGRELRAAAALARFDRQKLDESSRVKPEEEDQETQKIKEEDIETASEDSDDYDDADAGSSDAVDLDGAKLLDRNGRGMIKVCEDEDPEDQDAKNELLELQSSMQTPRETFERATSAQSQPVLKLEPKHASKREEHARGSTPSQVPATIGQPLSSVRSEVKGSIATTSSLPESNSSVRGVCTICSFVNEALCTTCGMCANVLDPAKVSNSWSCKSQSCQGSAYINAGDCGICGVCGQRRDDS